MKCEKCGVYIPAGKEVKKGFLKKKILCERCSGKTPPDIGFYA